MRCSSSSEAMPGESPLPARSGADAARTTGRKSDRPDLRRTQTGRASGPVSLRRPQLRDRLAGKLVGALVEIVAGMAAHPVPPYRVVGERGIEPLPQIDILHRLAISGLPPVAFPTLDPGHDAVAQILAVGVKVHGAGSLERLERRDRGHQLHAVVGGVRLAALELLLVVPEAEDRAPTARPGIAGAGAV